MNYIQAKKDLIMEIACSRFRLNTNEDEDYYEESIYRDDDQENKDNSQGNDTYTNHILKILKNLIETKNRYELKNLLDCDRFTPVILKLLLEYTNDTYNNNNHNNHTTIEAKKKLYLLKMLIPKKFYENVYSCKEIFSKNTNTRNHNLTPDIQSFLDKKVYNDITNQIMSYLPSTPINASVFDITGGYIHNGILMNKYNQPVNSIYLNKHKKAQLCWAKIRSLNSANNVNNTNSITEEQLSILRYNLRYNNNLHVRMYLREHLAVKREKHLAELNNEMEKLNEEIRIEKNLSGKIKCRCVTDIYPIIECNHCNELTLNRWCFNDLCEFYTEPILEMCFQCKYWKIRRGGIESV
jgi:hypothetical protein